MRQHPQQQPRWNYRNFLGDSSRGGSLQSTRSQPSAAASSSPGGGGGATSNIFRRTQPDEGRMPSLFVPEESVYDRYAACLAATEGLRRIRDRDLADEANVHGFGNDGERQINSQYVQNSERVLRALGMTVNQFNDLGRQITQDEKLRERVMEQAYLYRMAATINMDRMPLLDDPQSRAVLQAYRRDKVDLFCESMTEIEHLREGQIGRLMKSLRVDKFPENLPLSDPGLLPFLSPKVRAVVEAFPYQAEEIIKKHGLQSDEFNKMLEETRSNPLFRWKVQKHLRKDPSEGSITDGNGVSHDTLTDQHGPGAFRAHR